MAELDLPTLIQWRDRYLRDHKLRQPSALTGAGTQPYVDAVTFAGMMPGLLKNGVLAAERALIGRTFGPDLDAYGNDHGRPRLQGSGSFGSVKLETGTTGATYSNGARLKHRDTGELYTFDGPTAAYANGAEAPVKSNGVGRQTNAAVGDVLLWDSPPAGSLPSVTVVATNGKGLDGGADVELDAEYQERLKSYLADPPADANEGFYLLLVQEGNHGVPVDKAYVYPCILGPGTIGITFTVRGTGSARFPSPAQLAAVEAFLKPLVPFDDSIFMIAIASVPGSAAEKPIVGVKFLSTTTGYIDPDPFPCRGLPSGVGFWKVHSSPTPTATVFGVASDTGVYTGSGIRAGQTMAVWNGTTFVRKKILSFTGTGPYTITVDATGGASDTTYVPVSQQYVCPWSDKLPELAQSVSDYYLTLGPGENTSPLPDPGLRMRRYPPDLVLSPYTTSTRMIQEIAARSDILSSTVHAGTGISPPAGTAGINASCFLMTDLAIYPILLGEVMAYLSPFQETTSRYPTYAEMGGGLKEDDPGFVPADPAMPSALNHNAMSAALEGLMAAAGNKAIIKLTHAAGVYSKVDFACINVTAIMGGSLVTGDFTVTKNGVGDLTIQFAVGKIPPIRFSPWASWNHTTASQRTAEFEFIDGRTFRIRMFNAGSAADANVTIYVP